MQTEFKMFGPSVAVDTMRANTKQMNRTEEKRKENEPSE